MINFRPGDNYCSERNLQSYEIIIAKLPTITFLNRCEIHFTERRNCEKFFQVRFSEPPIQDVHKADLKRFEAKYGGVDIVEAKKPTTEITKQFILAYEEKQIRRRLSAHLDINQVVSLAARLLRFDPSTVSVKLHFAEDQFDILPWNSTLPLRTFEPEDETKIEFIVE